MKHKAIIAQLADIEFDIKEAESKKDTATINNLVSKFSELTQKLSQLHKNT